MADVRLPEHARFTCQSCGRCCQGWSVPVDEAAVLRLREHDWGGEPFEAVSTSGQPFRTRLVNGRCFFLDASNRCRIHSEISYDAKPVACRTFPLGVFTLQGRHYARLSFWCPTVVANTGKPLDQQGRWIKDASSIADTRIAPLTLDGRRELSQMHFEALHAALRRLVASGPVAIRVRLGAAAALLSRLQAVSWQSVAELTAAIAAAESEGIEALAADTLVCENRGAARRALILYLLQDVPPGRWSVVSRLASLVLFAAGLWPLRSTALGVSASRRQIKAVTFVQTSFSEQLLTRYVLSKLDARRYVMGDASVIRGFNQILAAYANAVLLARLSGAASGRRECDEEDVRRGVSAADLLVLEHTNLDEGSLRRANDLALDSADLEGSLLSAWP